MSLGEAGFARLPFFVRGCGQMWVDMCAEVRGGARRCAHSPIRGDVDLAGGANKHRSIPARADACVKKEAEGRGGDTHAGRHSRWGEGHAGGAENAKEGARRSYFRNPLPAHEIRLHPLDRGYADQLKSLSENALGGAHE